MVLKRIFLTVLSALGFGALAAGPVSAQQIPAPDFYGDAAACANAFPEARKPSKMHAVDVATEDKTSLSSSELGGLNGMSMPCNIDNPATANVVETDDVASGLAKARELYEMAADAIDLYEANDSEANMKARDEAVAARDNYAGGADTIYARVYAEEMARKSFLDRGSKWNDAKEDEADNQQLVDKVEYADFIGAIGFDESGTTPTRAVIKLGYVKDIDPDTDGDQSFVVLRDADGNNLAPEKEDDGSYTNPVTAFELHNHDGVVTGGNLSNIAIHTVGMGATAKRYLVLGTDDGSGNDTATAASRNNNIQVQEFDTDGDLTTNPFRFGDWDNNTPNDDTDDVPGLNARVKAANKRYEDAKEAAAANQDGTQQLTLDEAARKAKAVKDALDAQAATALQALRNGKLGYTGDNPLTDETETGAQTYTADDYRAYKTSQDSVTNALSALKNAYDARVRATKSVEAGLKDTGSYLEQLVALRQYEQQMANDEAEDADEEDLNDDGLTEAQVDANKALMTAEGQLAAFNEIQGLSDDNPVKDLVNSLLVANGDDADDDGQALVDAISATYDTAAGAADAAREVVNELTGEGGQVSMNTAGIEANAENITGNTTAIDALEAEVGMDENGMSRIDHNETRSMANATMIGENRGMIMTNAENIETNATNIMTNASEIVRVEGRVDTNWDAIAANQTAIAGNTTAIETNSGRISSNADAIAANMNSIGSNASAISDNRNMIGELSDDLDVVRAGVAASMALAGMPAINGRGVSIGVGSFDGESAFAVGFQIQGEMASFKVGVTSASGATGASAGVGFQF